MLGTCSRILATVIINLRFAHSVCPGRIYKDISNFIHMRMVCYPSLLGNSIRNSDLIQGMSTFVHEHKCEYKQSECEDCPYYSA